MSRLPYTQNEPQTNIKSDAPGVRAASPKKQIPIYPAVVNRGGNMWNFAGLADETVYPSPHNLNWSPGWVPRQTRLAMMNHHKVYQSENNLKNAIIGDGGRWIPAINPYGPDKAQWKEALLYARFLTFCWRQMYGSNFAVVRQMLDCMREGNKVAPFNVRDCEFGEWKGKWILDRLQVWPNDCYEFYGDEFGTVTHLRVGANSLTRRDWPREKFFVLTWRPVNGNPYGTSVYAPAYDPFYKDVQTDFEEMAYMATFGRPSVIVFAAPPPEDKTEEAAPLFYRDGKPVMEADPDNPGQERQRYGYAVEQNAILFTEFRAGSIWSLDAGAIVEVMEARQGGAELFDKSRDRNAKAIAGAIYGTHQVTESERVISQGNAEVGEGIAGLNVTEGKRMLEEAEENDLARMLLLLNFGPGALELLPIRDYGSGQNGRLPKILNAQVGFASNGAMDKAQYWDLCASNGLALPYPDSEPLVVRVSGTGGGDKTGEGKPKEEKQGTDKAGANG